MRVAIACVLAACGDNARPVERVVPVIAGDWIDITGVPDLGPLNAAGQQPVDFTVWQAADGTWHLWSCIRFTAEPGNSRLFYEWTSPSLTAPAWTPRGIAMRADPSVGEAEGGLQAPFVFEGGATFHLFYGAWQSICAATSTDGATFTRSLDAHGRCPLFGEGDGANTRDPMVLRVGDHWQVVYTAVTADGASPVFARTSSDLATWSASRVIAPSVGESPFVAVHDGTYVLFRTAAYGADATTVVYNSDDPLHFEEEVATLPIASPEIVDVDGASYIVAFKPSTDGMRIAPLRWEPLPP